MASSPYLGNYGIVKDTDSFKLTFDIPINCVYLVSHVSGDSYYAIAVNLAPLQKKPSPTFSTQNIVVECDSSGYILVEFELPSTGLGLAKRPKLTVNDLIP